MRFGKVSKPLVALVFAISCLFAVHAPAFAASGHQAGVWSNGRQTSSQPLWMKIL